MLGKTDYDFFLRWSRQTYHSQKTGNWVRQVTAYRGRIWFLRWKAGIFWWDYIPRFNVYGKIDGLIGYFRNMTERKTGRGGAAAGERELSPFSRWFPSRSAYCRQWGDTIYANKTILNFYGYESLENCKKHLKGSLYTGKLIVEAKRRKLRENMVDLVTPNMKSASSGKMEKFAISRFSERNIMGRIQRVSGHIRGYHQKKTGWSSSQESEAIFRSIFENSFIGISIASPKANFAG